MENNQLMSAYARSAQVSLFRSVYLWMTMALVITALMAMFVANSVPMLQLIYSSRMTFFGLIIAELALVWYLSARIHKISFVSATAMFILYAILNGATLASIFVVYSATAITTTFFVTAGTFGSMCLVGYFTKKDLTSVGNLCIMGVIGLIIASIVNMFLHNGVMDFIISIIGVLMFVGLTAYDSQKIKQMLLTDGVEVNETTQKIALLGALSLYLDFINLFLYLLRLFGRRD